MKAPSTRRAAARCTPWRTPSEDRSPTSCRRWTCSSAPCSSRCRAPSRRPLTYSKDQVTWGSASRATLPCPAPPQAPSNGVGCFTSAGWLDSHRPRDDRTRAAPSEQRVVRRARDHLRHEGREEHPVFRPTPQSVWTSTTSSTPTRSPAITAPSSSTTRRRRRTRTPGSIRWGSSRHDSCACRYSSTSEQPAMKSTWAAKDTEDAVLCVLRGGEFQL